MRLKCAKHPNIIADLSHTTATFDVLWCGQVSCLQASFTLKRSLGGVKKRIILWNWNKISGAFFSQNPWFKVLSYSASSTKTCWWRVLCDKYSLSEQFSLVYYMCVCVIEVYKLCSRSFFSADKFIHFNFSDASFNLIISMWGCFEQLK